MINKISTNKFGWNESGIKQGYHLFDVLNNNGMFKDLDRFEIRGFCFSKNLPVRPRNDGITILFFDKDNDCNFWLHFPQDFLFNEDVKFNVTEYKCPYCDNGKQTVSSNNKHFFCWTCKKWDYPLGEKE